MKRLIFGIILLFIGLWIWFSNLGIGFINFSRDWPVLIILLGTWIIVRKIKKKKPKVDKILNDVEKGKISVDEAVEKIKEG